MEEAKEETRSIDVFPLKKGKRTLLFLADFFIAFIIGVFLFSFAVFPAGKAISKYDSKANVINENQTEQGTLLIQNKLLYQEEDSTGFEDDLSYTERLFLDKMINGNDTDVFENYYVKVLGLTYKEFNEVYKKSGGSFFFTFDEEKGPSLSDPYATEFITILDKRDTPSSKVKSDYNSFTSSFFVPFYSAMLSSLRTEGSVPSSNPLSQIASLYEESQRLQKENDITVQVCSYVTYVIVIIGLYFFVPLFNRRSQTLGMMIMKCVYVDKKSFTLLPKKETPLRALFSLILNIPMVFFFPLAYVEFTYLFSYSYVLYPSLFSLVLQITSLFFIIFSEHTQGLEDIVANDIVITRDTYDTIIRSRGQ